MHNFQPILSRYPFLSVGYRVTPVGNAGGFSGAEIWRVTTNDQVFCLKKWPTSHPSYDRLAFIHDVLLHVSRHGLNQIAVPIPDNSGQTIVVHDGTLFELTRWLPGEADFERKPSPEKLVAAMTMLARFHILASTFAPIAMAPSPGMIDRRQQMENVRSWELKQITAAIRPSDWPWLEQIARGIVSHATRVAPRILYLLDDASAKIVALQPCIRDVWHDHVLFTDESVTGLIDFGSMRMDNVAGDVARLAGSLVADDPVKRQNALRAYEHVRPISADERELVDVFDQSTTLLGGLNWLRWIYCEDRVFADRAKVEKRLMFLLRRLQHLAT